MEVGIDVLDVDRMLKLCDKNTFYNKYFTTKETEFLMAIKKDRRAQVLAGYYSLKEAFLKACGIGIGRGIDLKDIEIGYTELGRPVINLSESAKMEFNKLGFSKVSCSISDTQKVAVAICIVE